MRCGALRPGWAAEGTPVSQRLVVVSNRIGDPRKPAAGGLAVALGEALSHSGGPVVRLERQDRGAGARGEGELHLQSRARSRWRR
jgi:trehalose 6-phosphate synthase